MRSQAGNAQVVGANKLEEFIALLRSPRAVMMLVPAGPPVDAVIRDVLPYLQSGDLVIDGGNSHFKDTDLRQKTLAEKGIQFMGMGYFDGYRSAWLPANLIQAQWDYFGAHTYERIDDKGVFHTQWEES